MGVEPSLDRPHDHVLGLEVDLLPGDGLRLLEADLVVGGRAGLRGEDGEEEDREQDRNPPERPVDERPPRLGLGYGVGRQRSPGG